MCNVVLPLLCHSTAGVELLACSEVAEKRRAGSSLGSRWMLKCVPEHDSFWRQLGGIHRNMESANFQMRGVEKKNRRLMAIKA